MYGVPILIKYEFHKNHLFCFGLILAAMPTLLDSIVCVIGMGGGGSTLRAYTLLLWIPSVVLLPIMGSLDLIWVLYFVMSGRSFVNLEIRKKHGKQYSKLLPHLVSWLTVIGIFWFNIAFVDRRWYDFP
jgi:hypothetical protein